MKIREILLCSLPDPNPVTASHPMAQKIADRAEPISPDQSLKLKNLEAERTSPIAPPSGNLFTPMVGRPAIPLK
jgi:hypothetical protein